MNNLFHYNNNINHSSQLGVNNTQQSIQKELKENILSQTIQSKQGDLDNEINDYEIELQLQTIKSSRTTQLQPVIENNQENDYQSINLQQNSKLKSNIQQIPTAEFRNQYENNISQNSNNSNCLTINNNYVLDGILNRFQQKEIRISQINQQDDLIKNNQYIQQNNQSEAGNKQLLPQIWRNNFWKILHIISKFKKVVKDITKYYHHESFLDNHHYQILNDLSYYSNNKKKKPDIVQKLFQETELLKQTNSKPATKSKAYRIWSKRYRKFKRKAGKTIENFSNSFFKLIEKKCCWLAKTFWMYWEAIQLFVMIFEIFIIPIRSTFEQFIDDNDYIITQSVPISLMVIDMILGFNRHFWSRGILITDKRLCFKNYISTFFWFDLIFLAGTMIDFIVHIGIIQMIFLFILWFRFARYYSNIIDYFNLQEKFGNEILSLINLLATLLFFAHNFACIWHFAGTINTSNQVTWLDDFHIKDADWVTRYIASIFFTFTVMTTIGFGDITPQNSFERVIALFIMLISTGVFAFSMNEIGQILNNLNEKSKEYKKQLFQINKYMDNKNINDSLQRKVRGYLDFVHREEQKISRLQEGVLDVLSKPLREEILQDINMNVLKNMKIFFNQERPFSKMFLDKLTLLVKEQTYAPYQLICGEELVVPQQDNCIYFINYGEVELSLEIKSLNKSNTLKILKEKETFGQFSFLTQTQRKFRALSLGVSRVNYINFTEFIELIKQYPQDYEIFCMIKDDLLFYQKYKLAELRCLSCDKTSHYFTDCPIISYQISKERVILNFNMLQQRQTFQRKPHIKVHHYRPISQQKYLTNLYSGNDFDEDTQVADNNQQNTNDEIDQYIDSPSPGKENQSHKLFIPIYTIQEEKQESQDSLSFSQNQEESIVSQQQEPLRFERQTNNHEKTTRKSRKEDTLLMQQKLNQIKKYYQQDEFEFDKAKNFQNYYTTFNIQNILKKLNPKMPKKKNTIKRLENIYLN